MSFRIVKRLERLATIFFVLSVVALVVPFDVPASSASVRNSQSLVGPIFTLAAHSRSKDFAGSVGMSQVRVTEFGQDASGSSVAADSEAVLVNGVGGGTRTIIYRSNGNPDWGLTASHLEKHLFGSGPLSLSQIDPAGNSDLWRNYIQDLASRSSTATLKGGIEDIVGTFPKADGSGNFQFGIRIAPLPNGTWELVTILTKQ
jgi:hypothetical protein